MNNVISVNIPHQMEEKSENVDKKKLHVGALGYSNFERTKINRPTIIIYYYSTKIIINGRKIW